MLRTSATTEATQLLMEVRNEINAYLGKHHHIIDEYQGYVYPDDTSGRLTLLQLIVGEPLLQDKVELANKFALFQGMIDEADLSETKPVTLLHLIANPNTEMTSVNFAFIMFELMKVAAPLADFPPLRSTVEMMIYSWLDRVLKADSLLEAERAKLSRLNVRAAAPTLFSPTSSAEAKATDEAPVLTQENDAPAPGK